MLSLLLIIPAAIIAWHVARLALRALVSLLTLIAVTVALAPRAYAAAKAERSLPRRDLAFDFEGNADHAKLFSAIARDRLTRTKVAAQFPNQARIANNIGRRFAGSALLK